MRLHPGQKLVVRCRLQGVFAYAFDMLLWRSRRRAYVLGFGPFPIIFSTNLFLWFRDDWFYLQFLALAVGFASSPTRIRGIGVSLSVELLEPGTRLGKLEAAGLLEQDHCTSSVPRDAIAAFVHQRQVRAALSVVDVAGALESFRSQ